MRPAQRSLKRVHLAVGPVTASVRNASVSKGLGDSGTRMEIAAELVRDVRSKDAPKLAIGTAYRDRATAAEGHEHGSADPAHQHFGARNCGDGSHP